MNPYRGRMAATRGTSGSGWMRLVLVASVGEANRARAKENGDDYTILAISELIKLSARTAIVTGGAMGIGYGIAYRLAEAGANASC